MTRSKGSLESSREDTPVLRVLVCPNAYKGSLTAPEAARAITEGLERACQPGVSPLPGVTSRRLEAHAVPLADGGDGTLETLVEATGGSLHSRTVRGPLGEPVVATWGRLGGTQHDTAVIEMAQASGLRLLPREHYDPLHATTYGTGELMRAAWEAGCRTLLIGIGGSATNDGGTGMAQALGARFLDANGRELPPGGAALARLERIDLSAFPRDDTMRVLVACDVDNPLLGPEGAAAVYGPQKGASPENVRELDAALARYADVLRSQLGADVASVPGAGAAGGLGAGLLAFCQATLRSGAELVLEATRFDALLSECHLALTGEGRLDGQTARGKVVAVVARRARAAGIPAIALAGSLAPGAEEALRAEGLSAALSLLDSPLSVEDAMRDAYRLLSNAAERTLRLLTLKV